MLRTALLATLAGLALTTSAPAQYFPSVPGRPPVGRHPIVRPPVRIYTVEYRRSKWTPWFVYARTYDRREANDLARYLRHVGFQARVEKCN
jgi:hypothetical protein